MFNIFPSCRSSQSNMAKADEDFSDFDPELVEIYQVDEKFCIVAGKVVNHLMSCNENSKRQHQKALKEQIKLSGSCTEGSIISRLFIESTEFADGINREGEVDIEFTLLDLALHMKNMVVDIPEKPGYVKLKYHQDYLSIAQSLGWEIDEGEKLKWSALLHHAVEDDYFQPHKLKEYFATLVRYTSDIGCLQLLLALALRKQKNAVSIDAQQSLTNATVDSKVTIKIDGEILIKCCYDAVPMFRLQWWPDIANEWKERKRSWPCKTTIQEFTKIGYLIAKPSNKYDETTIELRYAFSHIERELANMRTKRQKMIYLIFKIIWVKHVKSFDPDKISSFVAKTIMCWVCEEIHPDDNWWKMHYFKVLQELFNRMLRAFEIGFLPYYFIPRINVISEIKGDLIIGKIKLQLKTIIRYIDIFIPASFDGVIKVAKDVVYMAESVCEVFEEIERRDYRRLLRQPELIGSVLKFYINKVDLEDLLRASKELFGSKVPCGFVVDDLFQNLVTNWENIKAMCKEDTCQNTVSEFQNTQQDYLATLNSFQQVTESLQQDNQPDIGNLVNNLGVNVGNIVRDSHNFGNMIRGIFNRPLSNTNDREETSSSKRYNNIV